VRRIIISALFLMVAGLAAGAKDQPLQVVSWPDSGQPVLRFTFSKFKEVASGMGKERIYIIEVAADNLSDRTINNASFSLYVFDKTKARIGEGYISVTNVAAGETVKFEVRIPASGSPNSVAVAAVPASTPQPVSITVNSVPQGAALTVDGKAAGTTPKIIDVTVGKHVLGFAKEGFNPGKFPLEITTHDASGGSVSYELGSAAHDTIELRDGSVLEGDLVSVSGMQIEIRIGGNTQNFDRNQVKRILFTERAPASN